MAAYKESQSILDEALGEHRNNGFHLEEINDHITLLFHHDEIIGTYSQTKLTVPNIRRDCEQWLEKIGAAQ